MLTVPTLQSTDGVTVRDRLVLGLGLALGLVLTVVVSDCGSGDSKVDIMVIYYAASLMSCRYS